MALNLFSRYPGRANPASIDYPQGSFKNKTAPDATDGTLLEQDWANDTQGFLQSILSYFGVAANGDVDKVGASQYFDAITSNPTELKKGMPLVASQAEVNSGADDSKIVTSKKLRAGFASNFASNGYIAFPTWLGGFVIQWGHFFYGNWTPSTEASNNTVTFPIAFPNSARACLSGATVGTTEFSITNENLSNTSVRFRYYNNQTSIPSLSWYWVAIGN